MIEEHGPPTLAEPRQPASTPPPPGHSRDAIWGLPPVAVAIGITLVGVAFRLTLGMLNRRRRDFEPRILVQSFVLGWFASIGLVIGSIQHIPLDAPDLTIFQILVGETATVMGIDAAGHSASKRIAERRNGNGNGNNGRPPLPPSMPRYR